MRFSNRTYEDFLDINYINSYEYFNRKEPEKPKMDNYENIEDYEDDLKKYENTINNLNIDITRDYKNCLVIFDDFIYMTGKNKNETKIMRENIINMILQILNLGRKLYISCLITSHLLYERRYNDLFQNIYAEVNKFVFPTKNINKRQLSYILKSYFGFENKNIRAINKYDSNSHMIIYNKHPEFIQSENKISLLFMN